MPMAFFSMPSAASATASSRAYPEGSWTAGAAAGAARRLAWRLGPASGVLRAGAGDGREGAPAAPAAPDGFLRGRASAVILPSVLALGAGLPPLFAERLAFGRSA